MGEIDGRARLTAEAHGGEAGEVLPEVDRLNPCGGPRHAAGKPTHRSDALDLFGDQDTGTLRQQCDQRDTSTQLSTVLVADHILGPYRITKSAFRPDGMSTCDLDLAINLWDGKTYYYERVRSELVCADLTDNYTDVAVHCATRFPLRARSPAYFHRKGSTTSSDRSSSTPRRRTSTPPLATAGCPNRPMSRTRPPDRPLRRQQRRSATGLRQDSHPS
ncbi:hypothetical protein GCM10011578_088090 [Streptomyces fuscichromogenes]|uniref:Uncharacterized protein n=1 Tax=Streptomyces fuscichromogenes TaxID=1324013 RepID=A0A917XMV5_9ACTN|nr:hypothetical protein [Streptomyces fuscichromogenes]GGN40578.1 hypothetical protein GCM10011578_088090 [Streptomyces fuscichromogenes]